MSKIGKINISIPEKVKVALAGNMLNIEGPSGKKSINIDLEVFNLDIKDGKEISIKPKKIDQETKRLWGMNRSLINNAVIGSNTGYEKTLELVGVGYRAALKGNQLNLQLGYSNDINFEGFPVYDWIELNEIENAENLLLQDDTLTSVQLPFDFKYYGIEYQQGDNLTVCSNGWISLEETYIDYFWNFSIPNPMGPSQ